MKINRNEIRNDGLSSWVKMFSEEECAFILRLVAEDHRGQAGMVHATTTASSSDLRRCLEYVLDPMSTRLPDGTLLAGRIEDVFSASNVWHLGYSGIPSVRVMRYSVGDGYGRHTDWSFGAAKYRKISMTCQLTHGSAYEGGDVVLYAGPEDSPISRDIGMATMWPSWTAHEVKNVKSGVRYSLTAWAHGDPYR